MTYDQLIAFDAIVKEGSFKAASFKLHKSQPSISMAIKKLEDIAGFPLFSREAYRPVLTPQGKSFYLKCRQTLDNFESLQESAKLIAGHIEPEITISLDAICSLTPLKNILVTFFAPPMFSSLNLSVDILDGLYEKVRFEKCDFAIGSILENDPDLELIPFSQTLMIPVVHAKFNQGKNSLEKLKQLPQIIVKSNAIKPSEKNVGVVSQMNYWYTSDLSMKLQLIEQGLGWGRLPEHLINDKLEKSLQEITTIDEIKKIAIPLYLIRLKKKKMGINTKALWNEFIRLKNI
jgi:DNA-binding transcriptional LysR family regulator